MTLLRLICYLFIALWLTSCATITPSPIAQNKAMSWQARQQVLSSLQSWDIKASLAIRNTQEAVTAQLQWQQQKQTYHITLFGPLGSHSLELTGQPGHVELATANGQRIIAASPEALLAQQAGWQLPVSNLIFWIRGLPVPNSAAKTTFDDYHHLVRLKQQGWVIQFLRYTSVNGIDVPNKIFLDNSLLSVKIVINQWQPLKF